MGRTGTFICIDVLTRRLSLTSKVDVLSVVRELRFKRERTVETPVSTYNYSLLCACVHACVCGHAGFPFGGGARSQQPLELFDLFCEN